jgi:thiol-disulfide isomerase/thioredoxin
MRKCLVIGILFLTLEPCSATDFLDISFSEAQALASEQKKNIFLYFTAKWCGPCKVMELTVFPNDTISEELKDRYISLKVDADSWMGERLVKEFNVTGYPTIVIVDDAKSILKKHLGRMSEKKLMEFITTDSDADGPLQEGVETTDRNEAETAGKVRSRFTAEFGALAGAVRSSVADHYQGRLGCQVGLFLSLEERRWLVRPGALFVSKGGKTENEVLRLNYLEMPVDIGLTLHKGAIFGLPGGFRLIVSPFLAYPINRSDYRQFDYGARAGLGAYVGETSKLELLLLSESGFVQVVPAGNDGRRNFSISASVLFTF